MIRSKHSEIHQQKGRSVGFTVLKNINCVHKRALLKERLEELTYLKLGGELQKHYRNAQKNIENTTGKLMHTWEIMYLEMTVKPRKPSNHLDSSKYGSFLSH